MIQTWSQPLHIPTSAFRPLKVYMTQKLFSGYLKGLSRYRRIAFFFLKYLFSFQRYWRFSIMQIRSVMMSYYMQLKSGKNWINDICEIIKAVFLKLGTINVHHKRNKITPILLLPWQQFCHWCCFNKNWNFQFLSLPRTYYPTQSIDGSYDNMGTMSVPSRTFCLTLEVVNGDIWFLEGKRLEPKKLLWQQHLFLLWCSFMVPSFKNTAVIISEISFIQFLPLFSCM